MTSRRMTRDAVILVISHEQDPHAERVIRHLEADGQQVLLLNLSELPDRATLSIEYDRAGSAADRLRARRRTSYALHDVTVGVVAPAAGARSVVGHRSADQSLHGQRVERGDQRALAAARRPLDERPDR